MIYEQLGEMIEGDSPETCATKIPLMLMGARAVGYKQNQVYQEARSPVFLKTGTKTFPGRLKKPEPGMKPEICWP